MKLKKIICFTITTALALSMGIPAYAEDTCATVTSNNKSTSYASFEEAWNSAVELGQSNEVTFTLNKNWTANASGALGSGTGFKSGGLSYSKANDLTIDLNGYSIDRNLFKPQSTGAVIYVNSTMTIVDSRNDEYTVSKLFKGGTIQNGSNSDRGGGIVVADNATLNFNGGTILNCVSDDDGGAVSITGSGAKLNVNGGSFYGNRTYDSSGECCGGAIYSDDAQLTIANSTFEGNYAEDNGGAIYVNDGSCTITDSLFKSNSSIEEGGAIFADGEVKCTFTKCTFLQNDSTDDDGGAVYCDSDSGTYFYDCKMCYNHSSSEGGALHINGDKVFIIGGTYQYNTADENGGGIYVDSMYDLNAAGKLIIKDNKCENNDSDLCLQDGVASTAYLYCGGFYEGSSIWLCSNDTNSQLMIKGIEKYQYENYIHFDSGFSLDKITSTTLSSDDIRAAASVLGEGNILYICLSAGAIIVIGIVLHIIKKRKGAKNDDDNKE